MAILTGSALITVVLGGCGDTTPSRSEASAGQWHVSKGTTQGSSEARMMLATTSSAAGFEDATHTRRTPELRLVCNNPNLYFVYLDFGTGQPVEPGVAAADATVSYAIDGGPSVLARAVHVARERLWIRDIGLMGKIFSGHTIAIQFRPFEGSGLVRSSFSLNGLAPAVREQGDGCFDPLIAGRN
ncbi:MAG: hypothetical protein ABSB15_06025 [Bryobacteraceae bacterium]